VNRKLPENKAELLKALQEIVKREGIHDEKVFALALAYLIGDICPDDRTTKHVFRSKGN